jgi:hypothetical protein
VVADHFSFNASNFLLDPPNLVNVINKDVPDGLSFTFVKHANVGTYVLTCDRIGPETTILTQSTGKNPYFLYVTPSIGFANLMVFDSAGNNTDGRLNHNIFVTGLLPPS